ncbi:polyamine ABC transporter substrate-binding protein [Roseovarius sp. SK2]|jgi:putative spermidine/putrescine transport system substrate-binding protein|uniref:polyamine ABC transporter substrate-binding protein n=1 Tax=Roseovarius TaxID=74030 RepID=UPI000CDD9AD9|nr:MULTISPECIES: ABC transporter substrate-binding protein [Roseovarius]MDD9724632.1 polyamine ABC transporter substrate-binding protein [Roseovarius sp. SK2]
MKKHVTLSRRKVLAGLTGAVAAPMIIRPGSALAQSNSMTFVTWGGAYRDSVVKGVIEPFTAETGIEVNIVDTPDLAKVKAQVMTGNVEWDVFDAPGAMGASGEKEGYWEPLDESMLDVDDMTLAPTETLMPFYTWAGGIAWDADRFGEGEHPTTFAEYFDLEKFPGLRTFRDRPSETLEAALLADGVAPADVYPLDVERAFAKLDEIKSQVASWVSATPQTIALLRTGEVDFSYTYASRVRTTGAQSESGNIQFSFDQTLNGLEYLAVVKGAPNKENAMRFLEFAMRPEIQAATMELLGNAPVSKSAVPMLTEDSQSWLPDLSDPDHLVLNDAWWADNFEEVSRRFKEWVLI